MTIADVTVKAVEKVELMLNSALDEREFILVAKLANMLANLENVSCILYIQRCIDIDEASYVLRQKMFELTKESKYDDAKDVIDYIKTLDEAIDAFALVNAMK